MKWRAHRQRRLSELSRCCSFFSLCPTLVSLPDAIMDSGGSTCLCLCGRRSTQHRSSGICSLAGGGLRVQQLCLPGTAELAQGTFNDCGICFRTRQRKSSPFSLKSAQMGPGPRPWPWRATLLTIYSHCDGAEPDSCACYGIRNAFPTAKVSFVAIILNWNQGR